MKKPLTSAVLVILVVSGLVLVNSINIENVTAQNVTGVINEDTTWTQANSPYTLTGNVLVNQSATLTIEPGVTVYLNSYYIKVDGTLKAQGTNDNKITLIHSASDPSFDNHAAIEFTGKSTTRNETTQTGCIISNATVTNSQPGQFYTISITSAGPKISDCTITSTGDNRAIWISNDYGNSAPLIINNVISSPMEGITVNALTSAVNTTQIINNIICNCQVGIEVYGGNPLIMGNLIVNNTGSAIGGNGGIRLDHFYSQPTIVNNTIVGNTVGLNFLDNATATLYNNNIQSSQYNIYLHPGLTGMTTDKLNATNNYWGTTDTQAINQTIYDYKFDFELGTVYFTPFLTAFNIAAPTYVNATATAGGSISPNGIVKYSYFGSETYKITANSGYHVADVLVNDTSTGLTGNYLLWQITGPTSITAVFAADPTPTPAPTSQPTSNPTSNPTTNPTTKPAQSPTSQPSPTPTAPEFTTLAIAALIVGATLMLLYCKKKGTISAATSNSFFA